MPRIRTLIACLALWATSAHANFGGAGTLQVLAGWDSTYDSCEARWPGLQGYRDLMLMLAYGANVKLGSDDYRKAVNHRNGLRQQARYQVEYDAGRAKVAKAPADKMQALCQRMANGVKEALARQ